MKQRYSRYANQLSKKMFQASQAGPFAGRCYEDLMRCTAQAFAGALEKFELTPCREVIFCKVGKGGRIEVGIVPKGVSDRETLDWLDREAYRECFNGSRWLLDELGAAEMQVYFAADTDWPEEGYAHGRQDDIGLRLAQLY